MLAAGIRTGMGDEWVRVGAMKVLRWIHLRAHGATLPALHRPTQ